MGREIKLRGKDKYTGEWRIGYLIKNDSSAWIGNTTALRGWFEVEPESVGQFIGLYDKNGKEIYEGDVLLFNNDHPNAQRLNWKCVVKYRKGSFVCVYPKDEVYNHFDSWNVPKVTWEVIGNIYGNSDLLEVTP